jgi:tRNA (cytidine32/guanosine34-2'-O)-methyltransferase
VCRNFDPSIVPLPTTFSQEALDGLAQQTAGTLTLESLATLVPSDVGDLKEWEVIKAYVGGGDLK